jgi:TusA-related sulfurtransferase
MLKSDKTLDVHGVTGPKVNIVTVQVLDAMRQGQLLRVITNDRNSKQDIPHLCTHRGYRLLEQHEEGGTLFFTIQK